MLSFNRKNILILREKNQMIIDTPNFLALQDMLKKVLKLMKNLRTLSKSYKAKPKD